MTKRIHWASMACIGVSFAAAAAGKLSKEEYREIRNAVPETSEAKANLKALYTAQKAYFQEKDKLGTTMPEVGFAPEHKNRYTYFLAPSGPVERRKAGVEKTANAVIIGLDEEKYPDEKVPLTFKATGCPITLPKGMPEIGVAKNTFVVAAAGNIDSDPDLDCWSMSNVDRPLGFMKGVIKAGDPFHEKSDYPEKLGDQLWESFRIVGGIAELAYKQWQTSKTFPDSLDALVSAAGAKGIKDRDVWGNRITYRKTGLGITVSSPGPDGRDGTEDDLVVAISNDGKVSD